MLRGRDLRFTQLQKKNYVGLSFFFILRKRRVFKEEHSCFDKTDFLPQKTVGFVAKKKKRERDRRVLYLRALRRR